MHKHYNLKKKLANEVKYYGIHACLMLAKKRCCDIVRIYLDPSNLDQFKFLLKWCAQNKKAYHFVENDEMNRITDSVHHEGVCIVAKERAQYSERNFLLSLDQLPSQACFLYLDGVENPHNLGSILRTAAHFNVSHILSQNIPLSASACRIAKGGVEIIQLVRVENPLKIFKKLKEHGFSLLATSSHRGESISGFPFSSRVLFAIGSESDGLSFEIARAATSSICILGSGCIESLNVAVATGICLSAYRIKFPIL